MSTPHITVLMKFEGKKLLNTNPSGYNTFLGLLEEGEELLVTFKRKKFEKTNKQLALAYVVLSELQKHTGNSIEALDMWAKRKMGKCYEEKVEGQMTFTCASKADFTKEEMELYINFLTELAEKSGVPLELG